MTEKSNRFSRNRREDREETYIPTKFRKINEDIYRQGKIKDISGGGVRLDTEWILKEGDKVEFIVDEDSYGHYIAIAEVKWVGKWTTHPDGNIGAEIHKYGLQILRKDEF